MSVGVVIPCRNEEAHIGDVLDALASQDRQADDIVVVDDGSTDGTVASVRAWSGRHPHPPVRVVAGPRRGVAAAVNTGVAALSTDVVLRLDGHCRPAADYLRQAVALVDQRDIGVAGGVWIIKPGAWTLEAEAIAIAVGHPFGSGGAQYRQGQDVAAGSEPSAFQQTTRDVDTVPFGCFRRALWVELGGLDERLGANEDYEFNYCVRQRGLRVVLDPAIRCTYFARQTLGAVARQYGRYGWWKARMLVNHPASIRWRQLIAALVAPGLVAVLLGAVLVGGAVRHVLLACYPLALAAGAIHAAATRRRWAAAAWIAGAFAAVQVSWSVGFWCSLPSALFSHRGRAA